MEEVKAGAETTRRQRSRSRTKSTKRYWNFSTKDFVVPVYKRRKVARKKCSKYHIEESRCVVEDGHNQIKCCYVVLERLTEDTTKPNFRQRQKLDTVKISQEQCDVANVNLELSHVIADGNDTDQNQSDVDETCLLQHDEMFEDELTNTNTYQVDGVVLYGDEHLTKQCEVAVSKMRDILKQGSTHKHDAYRHPQYDSNQTRQYQGNEMTQSITQGCTDLFEEGQLSDVQFHVHEIGKKDSNANPIDQVRKIPNDHQYSVTVRSQFNAKKIRQYNAHSKRKSQCQSDSDTSASIKRQEHIVAGNQNLSDLGSHGTKQPASHGTKQTGNTKLRSKVTTDEWTFSKHEIEEQEKEQSTIDAVQISEWLFDVQTPDEPDAEASAQNIEVETFENDTHWTGRLSTLAAWRGRGSRKGVRIPPVSAVKAADEAELVYRFWPEDAQEVYRKEKAMSYLSDVRTTYRQSPQIYNMFVDLVRTLKVTTRPTRDIRQQVCKLFEENPHLITGFNMFLPTDTTQENLDGTDVNEGCLTKFQNKLVNQPTEKDTLGRGTYSTDNSLDIRNVTCRTMEGPMTNILNIPNQESKSQMSASEISMGSIHPLEYTVIAVPPVPVKPSRSLCDVDSVPCAAAMSKYTSATPGLMTMPITPPVCIPSNQSLGIDRGLQLEETLSKGLHVSRQFPQATKESISQPSVQITCHPTQIDELPINEPTTQVFAETMTDTTSLLQAEAAMQKTSYNDITHVTETHLQTKILIGSEAEAGTERGWGAEGESQSINQLQIEAASQTTIGSVTEKQLGIEIQSQTETQQATSQTQNMTGTDEMSQTENQSRIFKARATSYLTAVKTAYRQSPHTYNKFVDLVRSLKETKKPTEDIRQEICELFEDQPQLITGFNMFLPADTSQEICNEPGVNEGCLTKFENKLVTHNVNHSTVKNTQGPMTDSTVYSVGETSAHLVKDTLAYPASGTVVEYASKVVNSPWLNQQKCHSEKIIPRRSFDEQIRAILNIPIVYPKSKSMMNASEISMGCPKTLASIHPTEYTVMAAPPGPVEQSHSLCDVDFVACVASRSMDSSALDSDPLSTNLTGHPAIDTMSVDGTYTVKEGVKSFVLEFTNEGADVQEMKVLRDAYTSSFPPFPQATEEGISQPSVQITSHPTQIDELPISEPTAQMIAETVTDTTNQLNAEILKQHSSNNDKEQGTQAHSQTEILKGGEAASGTEIRLGTEKEAQTKMLEAASSLFFFSQTVKVSAMEGAPHTENHTGTEPDSHTKNYPGMESEAQMDNYLGMETPAQTENMMGTEAISQTDIQMGTEVKLQTESHQGAKAELQTESNHGAQAELQTVSHQGAEAELQTESHQGAEAESQTKSHQGAEARSQTDMLIVTKGIEAEAQIENQVGTEVESQTESHQEVEAESQTENYLAMEAETQTEKVLGTEVESQTEIHLKAEAALQTENHQGAEAESQTESHLAMEAESQTEKVLGTEVESQTVKVLSTEVESQTESHHGTEAESQTEHHLRVEAEAQTEKLLGSEATSQTESRLGVEVESQTENRQGTDTAFQTEQQARAELECQIKSDQRTLLPNAEPSASNMEPQNVDPVYVDEEKALSHVLETNNLVTRQMVRQMATESEAKSTQVLTGERSVNKVTLLGRVGRPAEMRGTADYPVTVFPLATSISIKRDDGTYEQQTEWHRISIFRKGLRDIAAASITTGDRVFVSGSIKYGSFEQDGRTVYSTSIIADDVIRLTGKTTAQSSTGSSGME